MNHSFRNVYKILYDFFILALYITTFNSGRFIPSYKKQLKNNV